jgi:hypothetical protein
MSLTTRQAIGSLIVFVLLLLGLGIWNMIAVLSDAEPFGYGASGIALVACAGALGILVVLLLLLLIAWQRTRAAVGTALRAGDGQPSLQKYWIILLICGWVGTFWALTGIARGRHWMDILVGGAILLLALGSTYQIVRKQQ